MRKIETNRSRNLKYGLKKDRRKKQLRSPLNLGEKVLVLAERIRKKDTPGSLYKASTENIPFFLIEIAFSLFIKGLNWTMEVICIGLQRTREKWKVDF